MVWYTNGARLLAPPFLGEGSIVAEVSLEEDGLGNVQFSRNLKPSTSAGRRLVVEWVSVSKDGARVTGHGKGGSSGWARQAAAQAPLCTKGFLIPALLQPADCYKLTAAPLGQCSSMDLGACMESAIVMGADRKMADTYIVSVRQTILKEAKAA